MYIIVIEFWGPLGSSLEYFWGILQNGWETPLIASMSQSKIEIAATMMIVKAVIWFFSTQWPIVTGPF